LRARLRDRNARREPPDLLVTALVALLLVVAAVCVLATAPNTWTLLLAVGAMVVGTLLLIGVTGLQLDQSERPAPDRPPPRPRAADEAAGSNPAPPPDAGESQTTPVSVFSSADGDAPVALTPTPIPDSVSQRSRPTIERLLFVADAAVADVDELPQFVRRVIDSAAEVYVITPALPGRLAWLADDIDGCRQIADERLDTVIEHLQSLGAHVSQAAIRGSVLTVIADAVTQINPDHILLALGASEHANWQEHGLIERIEQRFGLPLTTYAVDSHGRTASAAGPLLLCYDDTHEAARAIQTAGGLFAGRRAVVLTVRQPPAAVLLGVDPAWPTDSSGDFFELDREGAEHGGRVASDGVRIARSVGFDAEPLAVEATGPAWRTIVEVADRYDAAAIILGNRPRTTIAARLAGRVSGAVAEHAGRPTLVVGEPDTDV